MRPQDRSQDSIFRYEGYISIITPVYRAEKTFFETAKSVLSQTFTDFEWLVIVDDQNEGFYQSLIPKEESRIRWFSTGSIGLGPSCARNIGLNHANGDFICHLDADDLMLPKRLETLLPLAAAHGAVTDIHEIFDDITGKVYGTCLPSYLGTKINYQTLMSFDQPCCPLYCSALNLRWDEEIRFAEDVLFNLKLVKHNQSLSIYHQPLLRYRIHPESACNKMPEAYYLAKKNYAQIINKLSTRTFADFDQAMIKNLELNFKRKANLNEAFWLAYQAGDCQNFSEFLVKQ